MAKAQPEFTFDPEAHVYRIDGAPVPSVTKIIGAIVPRRFNPGDWYLERGRAIHHAIHLMAKGTLDWNSVDPRILPRVQAVQKFLAETEFQIAESEIALFSYRMRYAGTVDAILTGDSGSHAILTDFKSSLEPQVELQLGAYSLLMEECRGRKIRTALALELKDNGNYNCRWVQAPDIRRAENVFKAMLSSYGWLQKNGLLPTEGK